MNAITQHERRLIDEFIANNGVTRCPTGQMATAEEYVWDGYSLVPITPVSKDAGKLKFMGRSRKNSEKERTLASRAINKKIEDLFAQNKTDQEIANEVGITAESVKKRRHYMGLKAKSKTTEKQRQERRAYLLELLADGHTQASAAQVLKVSPSTVFDDLQYISINGVPK